MSIDRNPNTVIDGVFTLIKKIGSGGMASVYQAETNLDFFDYSQLYAYTQVHGENHKEKLIKVEQMSQKMNGCNLDNRTLQQILMFHGIPTPEKNIAIKFLKPNMDHERFLAEWRSLICLSCDHVIKVYGGGSYKGHLYYTMEYLDQLIHPKKILSDFTIKQKLDVIIDACKGVSSLHENGIIHRDLKPSNILTNRTKGNHYITKIADLGLALTEDTKNIIRSIVGTPHYIPPEQIKRSAETDFRSDIYSLGSCLYFLMCKQRPFNEIKDKKEVLLKVTNHKKPISLSKLYPNSPKIIECIIECAMNPDKYKRYYSVLELQQDLNQFIQDHTDLNTNPTFDNFSQTIISNLNHYNFPRYLAKGSATVSNEKLNVESRDTTPKLNKKRLKSRLRRKMR